MPRKARSERLPPPSRERQRQGFGVSDSELALLVVMMMNYELFRLRTASVRAKVAADVPLASELSAVNLGLMIVF
jgi:hypothetical protein